MEPQRQRAFTITFNKDPNRSVDVIRRHRPNNDPLNPVTILRKKKDLRTAEPIIDTHHEITHEGKLNPQYDKHIFGPIAEINRANREKLALKTKATDMPPVPVIHPEFSNLKANITTVHNPEEKT